MIIMVNQNQLLQMAGGFVGGFLAHNLTANNPALISPIIPGTPISKADALIGTLASISAIGGYVGRQPIYLNVGIGGVAGVITSKLLTQAGFSLSHHVNSALAHARRLYDNTFPSGAYGVNSAPVQNQNGLRKMSQVDLNAMNNGRMNSHIYGQPLKSELTRPGSTVHMADFSYT